MTLQQLWDHLRGDDVVRIPVSGICLEGAGINGGDSVEVDFTHMPQPPKYMKRDGEDCRDFCLCYGSMPSRGRPAPPCVMVKRYDGVFLGMQQVSTFYKDRWLQSGFEPLAILGVVRACYDRDGTLKLSRDVSEHPRELPTKNTIQCHGFGPLIAQGGAS